MTLHDILLDRLQNGISSIVYLHKWIIQDLNGLLLNYSGSAFLAVVLVVFLVITVERQLSFISSKYKRTDFFLRIHGH